MPAELRPVLGPDQGGGVEAGEHLAPGRPGGVEVAVGQPADEASVGRRRRQPLPVVGGEDLAEQDRHRPAVEHDVVVGQHQPVALGCGAYQRHPEPGLLGEVAADGRAFGGAQALDRVGVGAIQLEVPPGRRGVGRDDLDRLVVPVAEAGHQVRMPAHDSVHGVAQAVRVERAGDADVQLSRVQVVGRRRGVGVEQQTLLNRGQRQHVGDTVLARKLIELLLAQPRGRDVRRRQSAAAGAHVGADAGERREPQPAQPGDLFVVERRRRPGPVGVQAWAVRGVDGGRVEFEGVHQRHGCRRGGAGDRPAVRHGPPHVGGELTRAALAPQVVEPDRRFGAVQVDLGVEVAQQPVGQRVRQRPELFLGVFERGAQRCPAGDDLPPGDTAHAQRRRVFGGEPPHGLGQVDVAAQFLVPAVPLDLDADGRAAAAELRARQRERDQQDVLHAGVERRRHLAEQRAGGLGVQLHEEVSGRGEGVHVGADRGQGRRCRRHLRPALRLIDDVGAVRMLGEPRRPPGERGARGGQLDRPPAVMLGPGDVQVLQQDSPRHAVDGEVMHDHHELRGGAGPQRAEHHAGGRVQPRPRLGDRRVGQLVHHVQAVGRIDRARLGHRQRPVARPLDARAVDAQPQHRVAIQQRLQHGHHVGLGHPGRRLHQHGLVELIDLSANAFHVLQPADDRGRRHGSDALVEDGGVGLDHLGHAGQPRHGLLDEDVAGLAHQACGARPRHHLHRRNAVPAKVEERVVDADPLEPEHLGVDAGQDLFDGVVGGAVLVGVGVFRRGQRAGVQLAVRGQRQRLHDDHGGRNHVARQPFGQRGADRGRVGGAGDVADEALVPRPVLAGDDDRLLDAGHPGQRRPHVAELDAVAADLDLLVRAAEVVQLPVRAPAHQVAGAVHARSGRAEGARHEPRRGQGGALPVAAGHAGAGDIQLSDDAGRHGSQPFVEHERRPVGHRGADRHWPYSARSALQRRTDRGVDRGFGRPVGVDHHPAGRPAVHEFGRAGLTRDHQRDRLQARGRERARRRRGLAEHADPLGHQQRVQVFR